MPRKMPDYTNCVRVKMDFVLEFDKNPAMLRGLIENAPDFVKAGLLGVMTKERIKELFDDIHIVLGVDVDQARVLPRDLERRRQKYIAWVDRLDAPAAVKRHFIADAKLVCNRGKNNAKEGSSGKAPVAPAAARRARKEVPAVRKAKPRKR